MAESRKVAMLLTLLWPAVVGHQRTRQSSLERRAEDLLAFLGGASASSETDTWGQIAEGELDVKDTPLFTPKHPQAQAESSPVGGGIRNADIVALIGVSVLLVVALSPVLFSQGPTPFFTVLLYIVSICAVKVYTKQAFNEGFRFPYCVTSLHMLATAIMASVIDRPLLSEARGTFVVSAVKTASLGLNNSALVFGTAAFVSIIGALTPCTTFAIEVVRTRRLPLFRTGAILMACAGAAISTQGDLRFSLLALLLALGACVARSLKTVWSHDLLELNVSAFRLAGWSAAWSFAIMAAVSGAAERSLPYRALAHLSHRGLVSLLVSCAAAATLNILQCFCLKFLGPVVQNVFGSLELVAVVVLAIAVLHEEVGMLTWIGMVLICVGCAATKAEEKLASMYTGCMHWVRKRASADWDHLEKPQS